MTVMERDTYLREQYMDLKVYVIHLCMYELIDEHVALHASLKGELFSIKG